MTNFLKISGFNSSLIINSHFSIQLDNSSLILNSLQISLDIDKNIDAFISQKGNSSIVFEVKAYSIR